MTAHPNLTNHDAAWAPGGRASDVPIMDEDSRHHDAGTDEAALFTPKKSDIEIFLRDYVSTIIHVVSIKPDVHDSDPDKIHSCYLGDAANDAAEWVAAENGLGRNCYWTVNVTARGLDRKPSKKDIAAARFAHADIDPPNGAAGMDKEAALADLLALGPMPSFVIDSGNGLQPLWRLSFAPKEWGPIENINRSIAKKLGADNCHNIDRLLRVPGTINWPDAKKRARGRVPVMATLAHAGSHEAIYTPDDLTRAFPPRADAEKESKTASEDFGEIKLLTPDDLGLPDLSPLRSVIEHPPGLDRSKDGIRAAGDLLRAGFTKIQVLGILLNPKNRVSAHYLDQADPRRAALRVIQWLDEHKPDEAGGQGSEQSSNESQKEGPKQFTPTGWVPMAPKDMEPRAWLYGTSFIRSYLSASFGAPGGGKSSKRLVEAIAMATGRNLLGVAPVQRCRVWYWNGEDPQQETVRRVIAICMHYDIPQEELKGWLFTDSGRDTPIVLAEQGKDGTRIYEPIVEGLVAAMIKNKMDVLIVDPFVSCHRVAENDNGAIDTVAKKFSDVANQTNASVDVVHHIRKILGRDATVEDGRGASSLIGAARAIEVLNRMSKEEAKGLGVDEPWRYFCVDDGKGNMAPPEEREWFRFASVRLGNGTELYPDGDSVGVVDTWVPPKPLGHVTAADFEAAAKEIRKGKWKKSSQSNNWVGIAIARGMGLNLTDEKDKLRVKKVLSEWLRAGSLEEYEEVDEGQRRNKTFVRVAEEDE
jgi:hypothetical protein